MKAGDYVLQKDNPLLRKIIKLILKLAEIVNKLLFK